MATPVSNRSGAAFGGPPIRSVHFVYGGARGFSGADFHGPGVSGTEAALVVLAEAMVRRGMAVTVATPISERVVVNGVGYAPLDSPVPAPDLTICVKRWIEAAEAVPARARLLWITDVHVPEPAALRSALRRVYSVLLMSPYQRAQMLRRVPELGAVPHAIVGIAVNVDDYDDVPEARDNLLLFCSVPDRGLVYLARWMPRIFRAVPSARLVVASDYSLWGGAPARSSYVEFLGRDPRINYVGHVSRQELVRWQRQAKVMAYPCTFPEGFCVSAAECMAAGAVPVTSGDFALTTTVADGGVLVPGHPGIRWRRPLYRRGFVQAVVRLLKDDSEWRIRSEAARRRARTNFAPDTVLDAVLAFAANRMTAGTA